MESDTDSQIILVDDDKDILLLYSEYLQLQGFNIVAFEDPSKVMNYLQNNNSSNFFIIITDYKMPEISGIELIKNIHEKCNGNGRIKFILISAFLKDNIIYSNVEDVSIIHKILEKPFSLEELKNSISTLLN